MGCHFLSFPPVRSARSPACLPVCWIPRLASWRAAVSAPVSQLGLKYDYQRQIELPGWWHGVFYVSECEAEVGSKGLIVARRGGGIRPGPAHGGESSREISLWYRCVVCQEHVKGINRTVYNHWRFSSTGGFLISPKVYWIRFLDCTLNGLVFLDRTVVLCWVSCAGLAVLAFCWLSLEWLWMKAAVRRGLAGRHVYLSLGDTEAFT